MAHQMQLDDDVPNSFVDLLDELRSSNDVSYALRSKNFPRYHGPYASPRVRTPQEIIEATLSSAKVRTAIGVVAAERGWSKEATEKAARLISSEMAQNFDITTVRPLAYIAKKVLPRLFSHVYVNRGRFLQLKKLSEKSAIIFMPSHRTYMDFILLQFLCFHYELNLPAIAAAVDFLNMKFMGEALRRVGAFYIRRQFGNDKLYWAIFSEYVENQLKHADRPLEFFIEATRSRTGKSLHPKYGLLSVLLEPYFRNEIFDFYLVPVSVSFGKILEESLYAYELLGFPKPKESTSGLWKARTILNTDFGDVYAYFGQPISVRDYFTKLEQPLTISRVAHALKPSSLFEFTPEEQREIRRLGHVVVKINEQNAVVRLWSLACVVLAKMLRHLGSAPPRSDVDLSQREFLQETERHLGSALPRSDVDLSQREFLQETERHFGSALPRSDVDLEQREFLQETERLYDLTRRLRYKVPLKTGSFNDEMEYYLKLHSNIVERIGNRLILKPVAVSVIDMTLAVIPGKLVDIAVPRLMVANYANQAMHLFVDSSFVVLSILKNGARNRREIIFDDFRFLQTVFSREFISIPGDDKNSFAAALRRLVAGGLIEWKSDERGLGNISISNNESSGLLSQIYQLAFITETFLRGYYIFCDILINLEKRIGLRRLDEKGIVMEIQKSICEMLQNGVLLNFELLSGDMVKNCLHSLAALGATKKVNGSPAEVVISSEDVVAIQKKLWPFIAALEAAGNDFDFVTGSPKFKSKL